MTASPMLRSKIHIKRMSVDDLTFDSMEVWKINQEDINELMVKPQSVNPIHLPIVALKENNLVVTNLKHAIAAIWRGDNYIFVATIAGEPISHQAEGVWFSSDKAKHTHFAALNTPYEG